jgi:uncharacterized membrane-anchored protein YhcB (DUF1043 family)
MIPIPVVGTVIGLFAGGLLMRKLGPSLDKRKDELWTQLATNLDTYFHTSQEQINTSFEQHANQLRVALDRRIDAYISQYKTTVDRMIRDQQNELEQLNRLQSAIQWDLKEIDRRRSVLKEKQQQLAAIVV